jgi:two-component system response regulator DesR
MDAVVIKVLLVDDHPVVTDALAAALAAEAFAVIGPAYTAASAWSLLTTGAVDVAVVDIRLPDGSGLDLIARGRALPQAPAFLVLSSFASTQYVQAASQLGAAGYLLKTAPTAEITAAIRRVATGARAFDVAPMPADDTWRPLTDREREIVAGVMRGRSNDEIGGDLGIARKTVEAHLSRLYERLGASSRTDMALRAEREGWLEVPATSRHPGGGRT